MKFSHHIAPFYATVAQVNLLVADASLPDDVAYQLTKAFWNNVKSLENNVSVLKTINLQHATNGLAGVPQQNSIKK